MRMKLPYQYSPKYKTYVDLASRWKFDWSSIYPRGRTVRPDHHWTVELRGQTIKMGYTLTYLLENSRHLLNEEFQDHYLCILQESEEEFKIVLTFAEFTDADYFCRRISKQCKWLRTFVSNRVPVVSRL